MLHVLRRGFKFQGKTLRMAYFKPAHGLNAAVVELFAKNRLTVTRQVPCHAKGGKTLDMLLALNGLPIGTCELKNPGTGENWRHAVQQYRSRRDPAAPLFQFKARALVHFAVDPDEVHMTTRLLGERTRFLPFNRGSDPGTIGCGAGNPAHRSGYRTGYFWEDVLAREGLLEVLGSFMFIERKEEKQEDAKGKVRRVTKETLIFPRYHQLDAVRLLVRLAGVEGAGHNSLTQHSAGSGKTNTISWLAHRLASLHTDGDLKVFDCVVVITDRRVLDRQLQDAIYQIEHAQGVVKAIDEDSAQLALALVDGTKIVITTLQKFPFVLRGLLRAAGAESVDAPSAAARERAAAWKAQIATRRYAIIVDEAHSSQTGETAREMKAILGAGSGFSDPEHAEPTAVDEANPDEPPANDWQDGLAAVLETRGPQPNLSFFAFTATPKPRTLELFGRRIDSEIPQAIHVYSMRQAIEEGFILDVLTNYTTYEVYYRLLKKVADDPLLPERKATKALARHMSLHEYNIEQKTAIMVEHFRGKVMPRVQGQAKAMVVTGSRLHAVRYMLAFQRYISAHGYPDVRPLVAFSGTVRDPKSHLEHTEPRMNPDCVTGKPIGEAALPERFDSSDYNLLLVADKYQTGFDQPKLLAMYVDKRLDGVQAVQTLSRLNRNLPGKDAQFVLDFVNKAEDIFKAFKPYFDVAHLEETSDPALLNRLKHELDQTQVYHWREVEAFARVFYRAPERQAPADHAAMEKQLQPAVDRFRELPDDEARQAFLDRLRGFVRAYAFLSQIIPYADQELEMLYSFGRFLLPHLHVGDAETPVRLADEVALEYYRADRAFSGLIDLRDGDPVPLKPTKDIGTGRAEDPPAPLSEIIKALNERFSTAFSEEDRLFLAQIEERALKDEQIAGTARANPLDKFKVGVRKAVEGLLVQQVEENDAFVTRYLEDEAFQQVVFEGLAEAIFANLKDEPSDRPVRH